MSEDAGIKTRTVATYQVEALSTWPDLICGAATFHPHSPVDIIHATRLDLVHYSARSFPFTYLHLHLHNFIFIHIYPHTGGWQTLN